MVFLFLSLCFSILRFLKRWMHGIQSYHAFSSCIPFSIRFVGMGSVPFLLGSRPLKRPMSLRQSSSLLSNSVSIRTTIFFVSSMSLYIDMKMILPWKCLGSHFDSFIIFWISSRIPNVVSPGKISTRAPSAPRRFDPNLCVSQNQLILLAHPWTGSVLIPPRHSTGSEKTLVMAVANGTALSVNREVSLHIGCCKYSWWSQIFCVSFTRMNCILKSDRHKYTPYRCVHIEVFHLIRQTSTISLSHNREEFVQVQHGICVVAFGSRISRFSWSDQFPRTYWIFKKIQVFLVFFCRDKFPCTYVQNCNFLPSLRTRRCILIVYSHVKFPCTWTICSTGCFEYPRAFRRNQTTCRDKWDQARRKLWFCHDPVVSFLFLHPFRLMSARSVCAVSRSVIRSVLRSQPIPQPTRWISRLPQATC